MLKCESTSVETDLRDHQPKLEEKFHVRIDQVHHDEHTGSVEVRVVLPTWADRELRHEVLEFFHWFEETHEGEILVSPRFVVAEPSNA